MKTLQTGLLASVTQRALAEATATAGDIVAVGELMNHNVEALKRELAEQIGAMELAVDFLSGDVLGMEEDLGHAIAVLDQTLDTMASNLDYNFDQLNVAYAKQDKRIKDLEESVARLINELPPKDPAPAMNFDIVEAVMNACEQSNIFTFPLRRAA